MLQSLRSVRKYTTERGTDLLPVFLLFLAISRLFSAIPIFFHSSIFLSSFFFLLLLVHPPNAELRVCVRAPRCSRKEEAREEVGGDSRREFFFVHTKDPSL